MEASGVRRTREEMSSTSSVESVLSPKAKAIKMADEGEPGTVTIEKIYSILKSVQANTSILIAENAALKSDLESLKSSLEMQNTLAEELKKENAELKEDIKTLKKSDDSFKLQLKLLECRLECAETKNDDLEMYTRKKSIEIHGVPENEDEDVEELVVQVAQQVGVDIDEDDIDIAHRLSGKWKGVSRPIIAKFISHKVKSKLYFARRKLKGADLDDTSLHGAKRIYINENLTFNRRRLFGEVRKRVKQYKWFSAWTLDGKVFVCKDKGSKPIKIGNYADLEDIL